MMVEATRRAVIYTMNFTAKTYLFGPDATNKTIKTVQVDMYDDTDTTNKARVERVTTTPNPVGKRSLMMILGLQQIYRIF